MHDTLRNHATRLTAAAGAVLLLFSALAPSAQAQSYTYGVPHHSARGEADGASPSTDLIVNLQDNLSAKPTPSPANLNSTLCASLGGAWNLKSNSCTIASQVTAGSSFVIPAGVTLYIQGAVAAGCTFYVASGVTITNSGIITIESGFAGGFGACSAGTLINATSGAINITLSGASSIGVDNAGFVTNSGTITVGGATSSAVSYGIKNEGTFINDSSGTLTNNIAPGKVGIGSEGTLINYGTINNNGTVQTWAWVMINYGTICNRGTFYQSYNDSGFSGEWVNYGTFQNYGTIDKQTTPFVTEYPHNYGTCINETTTAVGCGNIFK